MTLTLGTLTFVRGDYKWTEADEQPSWEIRIVPGCGPTSFPTVQVFRQNYVVRPIEVMCKGSSIDDAIDNRDAVYTELRAANTKAREVLLTRTVLNQSVPDVWTVLGGVPKRIRQHWDGILKIWIAIDLYCYPGTRT
jgi:hypothetical protein